MKTPMDPDRLAALEEERRFLLRSLADLEREHDAGDVDDVDYRELRDGYTVRTATILRSIDDGRSALPSRPPANWPRRIGTGALVAVLIALVWWALSASSAQRLPGQQLSGLDPRDERQLALSQARAIMGPQPAAAAALYQQVLDVEPDNVEALTYRGWTLALSLIGETDTEVVTTTLREAVDLLATASRIEPDYPDPYCFLGIVQGRFLGAADAAIPYLDRCLERNPPADIRGLVEGFRESMIESADPEGE
jgi:tetratricopeptide (TPR) repeat protein